MHYSQKDMILNAVDNMLKTLGGNLPSVRSYPAQETEAVTLHEQQKKDVAALMRVNHAGEVCAQGLYAGQALTAKLENIRESMQQAAREENDHLHWCGRRLDELGSSTSVCNPVWYVASFALGAVAGALGDTISLGFVAEVEKQVHAHLQKHIDQLPSNDTRTRAILKTMQEDEKKHREQAIDCGAVTFPACVQKIMSAGSKIMTSISYRI